MRKKNFLIMKMIWLWNPKWINIKNQILIIIIMIKCKFQLYKETYYKNKLLIIKYIKKMLKVNFGHSSCKINTDSSIIKRLIIRKLKIFTKKLEINKMILLELRSSNFTTVIKKWEITNLICMVYIKSKLCKLSKFVWSR